jgi:hypothetical protein
MLSLMPMLRVNSGTAAWDGGGLGCDDVIGGKTNLICEFYPKLLDRRKWGCCIAAIAVRYCRSFFMDDVVDRALHAYGLTRQLDAERVARSREKIIRYIGTLGAAGQNDRDQLAAYALAYLKEMHEGPDPRFTGC